MKQIKKIIRQPSSKSAFSVSDNIDLKIKIESNRDQLFEDVLTNTLSLSQTYFDERNNSTLYHFYGNLRFNGFSSIDGTYPLLYRENASDRYPCLREHTFYDSNEINPESKLNNVFELHIAYPYSATTIGTYGVDNVTAFRHYRTLTKSGDISIFPLSVANDIFGNQVYSYSTVNPVDISGYVDYFNRPVIELGLFLLPKNNLPTVNKQFNTISDLGDNTQVTQSYDLLSGGANHLDLSQTGQTLNFVDVVSISPTLSEESVSNEELELLTTITSDNNCSPNIPINNDLATWKYNYVKKIDIKKMSIFYEESNRSEVINIPKWAINIDNSGNTRYRDILDIGYIENNQNGVDYPFNNNIHYINTMLDYFMYNEGDFNVDLLFDNRPLEIDDFQNVPPVEPNC